MGTIWNGNPSKLEVIGRCGRDVTKTNDHAEPTKSNAFFLYFLYHYYNDHYNYYTLNEKCNSNLYCSILSVMKDEQKHSVKRT